MVFQKIERENWARREYFEHYFSRVHCTYSMSVKLDITRLTEHRDKAGWQEGQFDTENTNRLCTIWVRGGSGG